MQLQNNNQLHHTDVARLKKIKVIIVAVAALVLTIVIAFFANKSLGSNKKPTFLDKNSGETISDPAGKSPEKDGATNDNGVLFLGFSKLLQNGIISSQLEEIKNQIGVYSATLPEPFKEVSLSKDSISLFVPTPDDTETNTIIDARLVINRTDAYGIKLSYANIGTIKVQLIKDSKTVFDSGVIDSTINKR